MAVLARNRQQSRAGASPGGPQGPSEAAQRLSVSASRAAASSAKAMALLKRFDEADLPEGEYVYVEVIETISESAVQTSPEWFDCPQDTPWRLNLEGYFERVFPE